MDEIALPAVAGKDESRGISHATAPPSAGPGHGQAHPQLASLNVALMWSWLHPIRARGRPPAHLPGGYSN
jgi:hypothetical protein